MNILSLENITKSYTGRKLLDETSFFLHENEKVGLIGINGTGKSTLLKIISGIEEADEGKRTCANNLVVRYLSQNPQFDENDTVLQSVLRDIGNDAKESDAKSLMNKLGIANLNQKVGELSGGQRKRLALVAALLAHSDILVLDEPTNHLDSEMSTYLEQRLNAYKGAIVMVTHDRYFLDLVCNRIVELDKGKLYSYDENYTGFLIRKSEREESELASWRKRKSILKKEIAWMMRGARARSTKQKAHIQRYENLVAMTGPVEDGQVEMSSAYSRLGNTTVEIDNISKKYGDNVLVRNFSYNFLKDDRVAFIGPNGAGKTTLMKMIIREITPDSGQITIGQTVKLGYYTQEISDNPQMGIAYMDPKMRVIDYIRDIAEFVTTIDGQISASAMLERFLFDAEKQYSLIGKLSGGEKRRLNLIRVLMGAPNVLVLDEPTNDLDIATLQILEDYIDSFAGIVIMVSHDRYFLDRIAKRIFAFEGDGVLKQYEGGYTDYESKAMLNTKEVKNGSSFADKNISDNAGGTLSKETKDKNAGRAHQVKVKFTYNEQREFETIDDDIAKLEEEISKIDEEMTKNVTNAHKLTELSEKKTELENALEHKMERWVYLNELSEKIAEENSK